MGYASYLIVISTFSESAIHTYDYPKDWYETCDSHTTLINHYFHCNSTSQSMSLAECLKVELVDFNTHKIIEENIDYVGLFKHLDCMNDEYTLGEFLDFKLLMATNSVAYFIPDG